MHNHVVVYRNSMSIVYLVTSTMEVFSAKADHVYKKVFDVAEPMQAAKQNALKFYMGKLEFQQMS